MIGGADAENRRAQRRAGGVTRRGTLAGLAGAGVATAGLSATALRGAAHADHDESGLEGLRFGLDLVASGFESPVDYVPAPEDRERHFVPDQPGVVHVVDGEGRRPEPFLDIEEQVFTGHNEAGLLGLAFHPEFAENRRFYVRYSAPAREGTPDDYSHTFVLSEFRATADFSATDPESERTLLEIPQPQGNHNAGDVDFGPDGFLYVAVGDGGAGGDQGTGHVEDWYDAVGGGNGQDVTANLLGSILRIDVDETDGERPYGIPDDNPLVGEEGLDEHYAWGLRNPWRMSFDEETGRLFVGDVGQNEWEEVSVVEKGGNYGWNVREGTHCFQAAECPTETAAGEALVDPILEYPHSGADVTGISVSGGHLYRGASIPALQGHYVFGDLRPDGRLFVGVSPSDGEEWSLESVPIADADAPKLPNLIAIGRGRAGELYLTTRGQESGAVYRVVGEEAAQTTTVAVDDTPPATDGADDSGQQAPATPVDGPGLGVASALAGIAASVGLARWFRHWFRR